MKRVLSAALCALMLFCLFSCAGNEQKKGQTKTANELEYEHALELEREGKWIGAYFLFEDLVNRGYHTDLQSKVDRYDLRFTREYALHFVINGDYSDYSLKAVRGLTGIEIVGVTETVTYKYQIWSYSVTVDYVSKYSGRRDSYTSTCSSVHAFDKEEGKVIPLSIDDYESLKTSPSKWEEQLEGDFHLYRKNLKSDYPDNIWNLYAE